MTDSDAPGSPRRPTTVVPDGIGPDGPFYRSPSGASPWPPPPAGWAEVLHGRSTRAVREAALVLSSTGITHRIEADGRGARIVVGWHDATRALDELEEYRSENADWPPPTPPPPRRSDGILGASFYAATLVLLHALASMDSLDLGWRSAGRVHARAVRDGELERVFTALTLHVDLQHLLSNLTFGILFGVLTAHVLGGGLTWFLTLLAGGLGNLANSWIQAPDHRSVGASTAVFGILGLLASYEWARRKALRQPTIRRWAPLFGGAVLLGWLGVGDPDGAQRVDVLAHVTGLASGGLLGLIAAWQALPERIDARAQNALAATTFAVLVVAWWIALSR